MTPPHSHKPRVVLFDATSIPTNRGGVGRVIESTVPILAHYDEFELHVVCKPEHANEFRRHTRHVHISPAATIRTFRRLIWEQRGLPHLAKQISASVVFSPHYTFPLRGDFARVVMIHDLTFFSLPELHSSAKKWFFRWWINLLARRKDIQVVAPSQATADAFVALDTRARSRVTVAHLGFDTEIFFPPTSNEVSKFASTLSPPVTKWVAFLGTLEPRKNVPSLIQAFSSLPEAQSGEISLLLSGGAGWDKEVAPAISRAQEQGIDVRTLGYLPQADLKSFLGGAELVAYPSLGEGFGLPVIEAMACGAPVLTTRELSLPEVGGEAAFYCETNSSSIAEQLKNILASSNLRRIARNKSLARAQEFSWATTASSMATAIQQSISEEQ